MCAHTHIPTAQPQTLRGLGGREVVCICPSPILGAHRHAGAEPGVSAVVMDMLHSPLGAFRACSVAPLPCSIPHPKMRPPDMCSENQLPPRNRVTLQSRGWASGHIAWQQGACPSCVKLWLRFQCPSHKSIKVTTYTVLLDPKKESIKVGSQQSRLEEGHHPVK